MEDISKQRHADQTQTHQSKKRAKDYDSETHDMVEVEDLSKKNKPAVRNADQTQKNQTKEVANNIENNTVNAMSELEDLPKNREMPPAWNVQQMKCFAIQKKTKMKNHISNRAPNQKADNGSKEGYNKVHTR